MKITGFIMLFLVGIQLSGQTLEFKNSRKIYLDDKELSRIEIHEIMKNDLVSLEEYKLGKKLRTIGDVTFFGGLGVMVGGVLLNIFGVVGEKEKKVNGGPWGGYYGTYTETNYTLSYGIGRRNDGSDHSLEKSREEENKKLNRELQSRTFCWIFSENRD